MGDFIRSPIKVNTPKTRIMPKLRLLLISMSQQKTSIFAERTGVKIFWPNRYENASYEWPVFEQFMGRGVLPHIYLLRWTMKVEAFLWLRRARKQTNKNTKQTENTKTLMQTSWSLANFAVYLRCTLQLHVWGCLCWEWSQWNSFKSGHYIPHVKFYPIIRTQNSLW